MVVPSGYAWSESARKRQPRPKPKGGGTFGRLVGAKPISSLGVGSIMKPQGKKTNTVRSTNLPGGGYGYGYVPDPVSTPSDSTTSSSSYSSYGSGGGYRGGGGGGGGGGSSIDADAIIAQLNSYRPKKYSWTDITLPEYKPPEFYGFDNTTYEMMRDQIAQGIANARTRGGNAYAEARQQMQGIPLAFQGAPTTTDPGMSAAMQRMFAANDTPLSVNERTLNEGVQADQAFGNLFAILGANERQQRDSRELALSGDERRLGEELDQQALMMNMTVDLQLAKAKEAYEKEKWAFGEQVARQNYETRREQILANAQGRQQTANANVDLINEANQAANQTVIDLLAQGIKVDPNAYKAVT